MATRIEWKNRPAMIERGKRIILANWRNRMLDLEDRMGVDCILSTWFERNVYRYAASTWGLAVKPTNMNLLQKRFWNDVIDQLEIEYEIKES